MNLQQVIAGTLLAVSCGKWHTAAQPAALVGALRIARCEDGSNSATGLLAGVTHGSLTS